MATIIVFGPPGCGKTRNAEMLRQHFRCREIVDGWDGDSPLPPDSLALTVVDCLRSGVRTIAFADAMKQAGRKGNA